MIWGGKCIQTNENGEITILDLFYENKINFKPRHFFFAANQYVYYLSFTIWVNTFNGLDNITCLDKINTDCLEESYIPIQTAQQNALKRLRSNGIINNTKDYTKHTQYQQCDQ